MQSSRPLVDIEPRVRIVGSLLGQSRSRRRGSSRDVVGSRLYVPGDDMRLIDWSASARLTSATGQERFIVREFYAEEAPTVVMAVDTASSMSLYPSWLPWLHKPAAVASVIAAVAESAAHLHCLGTSVTCETEALEPPRSIGDTRVDPTPAAQTTRRSRRWLSTLLVAGERWLPPGTLVFVISDFLEGFDEDLVACALDFEWDLVPVVVSDPVWERSFPVVVGAMTLPLADERGRLRPRRISSREAAERREVNETSYTELLAGLRDCGFPPVIVSSAETIGEAFVYWSLEREGMS